MLDSVNKQFVRTEVGTGRQWIWPAKDPQTTRRNYVPSHGVSMKRLLELGHKVRVMHQRWGVYLRQGLQYGHGFAMHEDGRHSVVLPAGFKKSMDYDLDPFGGYTHIQIKHKTTGKVYFVSAECSAQDNYCYKEGVRQALEHLTKDELTELVSNV